MPATKNPSERQRRQRDRQRTGALLNKPAAAEFLGVGLRTYHRLKQLPGFPADVVPLPGGLPLVRRSDLQKWVDRLGPADQPRAEPEHLAAGKQAKQKAAPKRRRVSAQAVNAA